MDDASCDTSSWSLAYDAMEKLLHDDSATTARVRTLLIHDKLETFYAWMITALAPWSSVPGRVLQGPKAKPVPPRTAEVARDSLRSDNKTISVLTDSSRYWESIIQIKSSLLQGRMEGAPAEIRQQIGLHIRSWKKDWRLCIVLSMLQEIMQGAQFSNGSFQTGFRMTFAQANLVLLTVVDDYHKFLTYIVENDLEEVCTLKPIVNGGEIMEVMAAPKGPWMSKASEEVIKWQLLHPQITEKQKALDHLLAIKGKLGLS